MPTYSYLCDRCGPFEVKIPINDYDPKKATKCIKCGLLSFRDFATDVISIHTYVNPGDGEVKLGHLAQRNSERLSQDEKKHLDDKHNEYRRKKDGTLPKGMKRFEKPSTKQRQRDPKKKKHAN